MITLYNDDCLNVIKNLNLTDCVFVTDPPFNVGYHYSTYKDKMPEDDYYKWLSDIFGNTPCVVIHYPESLYKLAFKMNRVPNKLVSWVYNSMNPRQHRDIAFFDVVPDFSQVTQPYKNLNDKRIKKRIAEGHIGGRLYDWWNINQVKNVSKDKTAHPCQMPIEVMENVVGILPKDKIIIDPFLGSGTTGVACKNLNRNFIGIELDEKYFEIAKGRINGNSN